MASNATSVDHIRELVRIGNMRYDSLNLAEQQFYQQAVMHFTNRNGTDLEVLEDLCDWLTARDTATGTPTPATAPEAVSVAVSPADTRLRWCPLDDVGGGCRDVFRTEADLAQHLDVAHEYGNMAGRVAHNVFSNDYYLHLPITTVPTRQADMPTGSVITMGHPANGILAVKIDDTRWRYLHDGTIVDNENFRGTWDVYRDNKILLNVWRSEIEKVDGPKTEWVPDTSGTGSEADALFGKYTTVPNGLTWSPEAIDIAIGAFLATMDRHGVWLLNGSENPSLTRAIGESLRAAWFVARNDGVSEWVGGEIQFDEDNGIGNHAVWSVADRRDGLVDLLARSYAEREINADASDDFVEDIGFLVNSLTEGEDPDILAAVIRLGGGKFLYTAPRKMDLTEIIQN